MSTRLHSSGAWSSVPFYGVLLVKCVLGFKTQSLKTTLKIVTQGQDVSINNSKPSKMCHDKAFEMLCCCSSHFLITLAIGAILAFMVLRNVVKIQMPNPTDMFVSNVCYRRHCHRFTACWCHTVPLSPVYFVHSHPTKVS